MNELEEKAVEDIEHELEVSKQFPYLHKPREVAKQLVLRCGYGKVKEYQEEIDRLKAENTNLTASLESAQQDKANLERTIEEMNEILCVNNICIDCDGNVKDSQVAQAKRHIAEAEKQIKKEIFTELQVEVGE